MQINPINTITLADILMALKDHLWMGIAAIVLYLIVKYVPSAVNKWFDAKQAFSEKQLAEITKMNDRHFGLFEQNTKAIDKIGDAITSFEKAQLSMESRLILKMEDNKDEIITAVRDRKLDEIGRVIQKSSPNLSLDDNGSTSIYRRQPSGSSHDLERRAK